MAATDQAVVYCANDDLGYVKSFERVVRLLTEHLQVRDEGAPRPHFRELMTVEMDGKRVGVASSTMTRDADGDAKVIHRTAMLLQAGPGQLAAQDTLDLQWVRPDGSMINALQVKVGDGGDSEDMALERDEEGRWRANGTLHGKDVAVELAGAPASYVEQAMARRQLLARPDAVGAHTEAMVWSSLDLTRLLPARASVLAARTGQRFAVREEVGGMAIEAELDANTGTMTSALMPIGPRTLRFERVLVQGSF